MAVQGCIDVCSVEHVCEDGERKHTSSSLTTLRLCQLPHSTDGAVNQSQERWLFRSGEDAPEDSGSGDGPCASYDEFLTQTALPDHNSVAFDGRLNQLPASTHLADHKRA